MSRKRKRRRGHPASKPTRETTPDQVDLFWTDPWGRRMFVVGYTSGGAPYGVYEDEIDLITDNLDASPPYDFP